MSKAEYEHHEQFSRSTSALPVEFYYVDQSHPRYEMPFHWHVEVEFITVLHGKLKLLLNGQVVCLDETTSVFIPGGVIHGGFPNASDVVYKCIVLNVENLLQSSPSRPINSTLFNNLFSNIFQAIPNSSVAGQTITSIFDELDRKRPGYEFFITGNLWNFFGAVYREGLFSEEPDDGPTIQYAKQFKQALRKIRDEYYLPLTLQDVSAAANMAPKYFCRIFRKITGQTFVEYLNHYRIDRAVELMYASDKSLTEISLQCGFNELSYFSRIFRKYKGMSPREYRQQYAPDSVGTDSEAPE